MIEEFKNFAQTIVHVFVEQYLWEPTKEDVRHMDVNRARGWVGMFDSLDCTHWSWKNFPFALQDQYRDKDGENSMSWKQLPPTIYKSGMLLLELQGPTMTSTLLSIHFSWSKC